MNRPGWILVVACVCAILYILWAPALLYRPPIDIRNCSVQEADGDRVSFSADIYNRSDKVATAIYVLVATSALVEYDFTGTFLPGHWTHQHIVRGIGGDASPLASHVGKITECNVHGVVYQNHTFWNGGARM